MKIKGLKKAVGERNNWIKRNYSHIANIMLDKTTGEIWCDCFQSANTWRIYHSEDIIKLNDLCSYYDMPITMRGIKITLARAIKDGIIPEMEIGGNFILC